MCGVVVRDGPLASRDADLSEIYGSYTVCAHVCISLCELSAHTGVSSGLLYSPLHASRGKHGSSESTASRRVVCGTHTHTHRHRAQNNQRITLGITYAVTWFNSYMFFMDELIYQENQRNDVKERETETERERERQRERQR